MPRVTKATTTKTGLREVLPADGRKNGFLWPISSASVGERPPMAGKFIPWTTIYPHADLVTYPSTFEGFGNAFLEAVYFKRPIVVNKYSIYAKDIEPQRFQGGGDRRLRDRSSGRKGPAAAHRSRALPPDRGTQTMPSGGGFFSYRVLSKRLRGFIQMSLGGIGRE